MDALINQDNFTNITIIEDDIALKGERVSVDCDFWFNSVL